MKLPLILLTILIFISTQVFAQVDTIQTACIGNSITAGFGLGSRELDCYPSQLGRLLGNDYQVKNFSVSGRTMLKNGDAPIWNENVFKEALEFNPDIVIILLGTNDSKPQNWIYKEEFIPDYISMIDTFRYAEPEPIIYACYPPPDFINDRWGIRDSIITTDIIPMIDKIIDSTGVSLIDFYSSLLGKDVLFPDGIHPSEEGSCEMAKIVASTIANVNFDIETISDINLAKDRSVTVSGFNEFYLPEYLNDGDRQSKWRAEGFGNWALIDFGSLEEIDMFQIDFGDKFVNGYQYIIEVSDDSVSWTTVVDNTTRDDTVSQVSVDQIEPISTRYIRIIINGALKSTDEIVSINEFIILKKALVHAPVLSWRLKSDLGFVTLYYLDMIPTSYAGELIKVYKKVDDGQFFAATGFRDAEIQEKIENIKPGQMHYYYSAAYKDMIEIISDTLVLNTDIFASVFPQSQLQQPVSFNLLQNYPNPFNAQTQIGYSLTKQEKVKLTVYNLLGQEMVTLVDQVQPAGTYTVHFDALRLSSGVYIYNLYTRLGVITRKMLYLK